MKKKEFLAEIAELSGAELVTKANELRETLMRNRFRKAFGQGSASRTEVKKNIARIETIRKQRGK